MKILSSVLAHTGNDAIEHGMETFDWILLVLMVIGLFFLFKWLIKRRKFILKRF